MHRGEGSGYIERSAISTIATYGLPDRCIGDDSVQNIRPTDTGARKPRIDKLQLDDFDQCVIRRTVNDMITRNKVLPTVPTLHKVLRDSIQYKGGEGAPASDPSPTWL